CARGAYGPFDYW
nr:immunoglobulin heavy chain junction region [Mus musculus]